MSRKYRSPILLIDDPFRFLDPARPFVLVLGWVRFFNSPLFDAISDFDMQPVLENSVANEEAVLVLFGIPDYAPFWELLLDCFS